MIERGPVRLMLAAAAVISAWGLGKNTLTSPPMGSRGAFMDWFRDGDGIIVALTLARLLVLVAASYLLILFGLTELGRLRGLSWLGRLARSIDHISGLGLVTLVAVPSLGSPVGAAPAPAQQAFAQQTAEPDPAPPPTLVVVEDPDTPPDADHLNDTDQPPGADLPVLVRVDHQNSGATHHVVATGEHLWSIAADQLDNAWGRAPTETEIAPYWQSLIDTNRSLLVDPDEPDLIWPGQAFVLPDPGPDPAA